MLNLMNTFPFVVALRFIRQHSNKYDTYDD